PSSEIQIPADIIRSLEKAFKDEGLKPRVMSRGLRDRIRNDFPLSPKARTLGGAPAIIAETLCQLEVDARFYAMYHSEPQAELFGGWGTKRVYFSEEGINCDLASGTGKADHPTRNTYVLAYPEGLQLESGTRAKKTDRSLLLMPYYLAPDEWPF